MASKEFLNKILADNSVEAKYYMEYGRFLANHLCHGVIALYKLGASEDKIADFAKAYAAEKLELRDQGPTQKAQDDRGSEAKSEKDIAAIFGKRTRFYDVLKHYKAKGEKAASIDDLVTSEFPRMMEGMIASAVHPLIHIGYGYSIGNLETVVEGLAYLHHSHMKFEYDKTMFDLDTFGKGEESLEKVITDFRDDEELYKFMKDNENSEYAIGQEDLGYGQKCMRVLTGLKGNELMTYAHRVKIGVDPGASPSAIAGWITDAAISLYARSSFANEFFLLHGVTSSWALEQFIHVLPNPAETLRIHFCNLLAAYLTEDKPELQPLKIPETVPDWKDIIHETLALPMDNTDEHIFKLVQVCLDRSKINSANDSLYKAASIVALNHPLCFRGRVPDLYAKKFTPKK